MPSLSRPVGTLLFLCAGFAAAQAPASPDASAQPPRRPPEGSVIIILPSADANSSGSLEFRVSHRFAESVSSDTHSFFSFFSPAQVNLGLSYTPWRGIEAGFLRGQSMEDYEFFGKWSFLSSPDSPFHAALRLGVDWRTNRIAAGDPLGERDNRSTVFVQGIVAMTIASRVRITAVPTYVSKGISSGADGFGLFFPRNVFNVPVAVSAAITRSINVQGEVIPRREGSPAVGWIAAVEKTVLRHRFSFTVGNVRTTTVDQYILPNFIELGSPRRAYFGFNIARLWKLN